MSKAYNEQPLSVDRIGALDLDIADAHKAEERLLEEYIHARHLDAAQATAKIARLRSIQYQTHIADYLHVVRQDIGRIDWSGQCTRRPCRHGWAVRGAVAVRPR